MKRTEFTYLICLFISLVKDTVGSVPECQNGGYLDTDYYNCICLAGFTGYQCEIQLLNEDEKKLQEDIQRCYDPQVESIELGSGSGSGSGEGSGFEPTPITPITCNNPEKRPVKGKCEFYNTFEGFVFLNKNLTVPETECVLEAIFTPVEGFIEVEAKRGKLDTSSNDAVGYKDEDISDAAPSDPSSYPVPVHYYTYIVHASSDASYTELRGDVHAAVKVSDVLQQSGFKDLNECITQRNTCDSNSTCTNNIGSYTCECNLNYTDVTTEGERPGSKCRYVCAAEYGSNDPYCMNEGVCHITLEGNAMCDCPINYAGDQCENDWHIFLNATIGLTVALGLILVIFAFVTLMLYFRNRIERNSSKSNFVELESHSANGEFSQPNETTEIKGISNPYVSSDEGITVATNSKVDDEPDVPEVEEDRL
uniref:neurogenic locus Notch protein-like isoform X1 n=1 Tax=Styela clava TaxID=7725 RepID=UPI0019397709|nr:neurogenic locus Notch protein-like isoform X1 [Styela clava]